MFSPRGILCFFFLLATALASCPLPPSTSPLVPNNQPVRDKLAELAGRQPHVLSGYQNWMHQFSRPLGPQDFSNSILQSTTSEVLAYGAALGISVGIIIAVGIVMCLIGVCLHCMDWCGKKTGRCLPEGKEENLIVKWWPATLVVLSSLAIIILCIIAIIFTKQVDAALNDITGNLSYYAEEEALRVRGVGPVFADLSLPLKCNLTINCVPTTVSDVFGEDSTQDTNYIADSWRDANQPGLWDSQGPNVWFKANDTESLVKNSNVGRQIYFWITIAVVLVVVLIGLVGAFAKPAPVPHFAGCLAFLAILFLWVLMAVHLMLATGGSDLCDDSNEFIRVANCALDPTGTDCQPTDHTVDEFAVGIGNTKQAAGLLECNSVDYTFMSYFVEVMVNETRSPGTYDRSFGISNPAAYCEIEPMLSNIAYSISCLWLVETAVIANEPICSTLAPAGWNIFIAALLMFLFFLPFSLGSIVIWKRRLEDGTITVVMNNNEIVGGGSGSSEEIIEEYETHGGYGGGYQGVPLQTGVPATGVPVDGSYSGSGSYQSPSGSVSGSASGSPSGSASGSGSYDGS